MKASSRPITVGQAARRTGLSPKAIRLYESRGLLPSAQRTVAGYRTYSEGDVALLRFVRQAKALGLSLDEIKQVVDLQRGGAQPCGAVIQLLDRHLREIDETVNQLKALRKGLQRAREAASASQRNGEEAVVCRIIEFAPR